SMFHTVLAIHNLILEEQRLFQVAHPVRYDGRRALPHAARRSGRLRGVKHGFALHAMSLRDGIPLPDKDNLHQTMQFFVKITMTMTSIVGPKAIMIAFLGGGDVKRETRDERRRAVGR
ncbi:MAG: hypothetical protein IKX48_16280, partial [Victivallales bacterium]|nr:hypothetical protein [Victivallales bacterium]